MDCLKTRIAILLIFAALASGVRAQVLPEGLYGGAITNNAGQWRFLIQIVLDAEHRLSAGLYVYRPHIQEAGYQGFGTNKPNGVVTVKFYHRGGYFRGRVNPRDNTIKGRFWVFSDDRKRLLVNRRVRIVPGRGIPGDD